MKTTFVLTAEPGLTGFKLHKEGEKQEREFSSISQAMLYTTSLEDGEEKQIVVRSSSGMEIARMEV